MSRRRPPLYLRAAVILGVAVLLVGLSGIVWLPDTPLPPERYAGVRVTFPPETSAPSTSELSVVATWSDAAGTPQTETGSLSESGRLFLFRQAPGGASVRFVVRRRTGEDAWKELANTEGVLSYGGALVIHVVSRTR